jgi:hypothetical protein
LLVLDCGVLHHVEALEERALLLTMFLDKRGDGYIRISFIGSATLGRRGGITSG